MGWLQDAVAGLETIATGPVSIPWDATKAAVGAATGGSTTPAFFGGGSSNAPPSQATSYNKAVRPKKSKAPAHPYQYSGQAITDSPGQENAVRDYTTTGGPGISFYGQADPSQFGSNTLSDKQFDTLTQQASRGNKLAKSILDAHQYKAQGYPNAQTDIKNMTQPLVDALSGLEPDYQALKAQTAGLLQQYNFTNGDAQAEQLAQSIGGSGVQAPNAQTTAMGQQYQDIVNNAINAKPPLGITPSLDTAFAGAGKAAKLEQETAPYANVLSALMSRLMYQIEYPSQTPTPQTLAALKQDPAFIQSLLAAVQGSSGISGVTGGVGALPSAAVAAGGGLGTTNLSPSGTQGGQ